jgi:hypothetical protein
MRVDCDTALRILVIARKLHGRYPARRLVWVRK